MEFGDPDNPVGASSKDADTCPSSVFPNGICNQAPRAALNHADQSDARGVPCATRWAVLVAGAAAVSYATSGLSRVNDPEQK